jgi:hypothetical protein
MSNHFNVKADMDLAGITTSNSEFCSAIALVMTCIQIEYAEGYGRFDGLFT